jgi:hypothetical protein
LIGRDDFHVPVTTVAVQGSKEAAGVLRPALEVDENGDLRRRGSDRDQLWTIGGVENIEAERGDSVAKLVGKAIVPGFPGSLPLLDQCPCVVFPHVQRCY